MSSYHECVGDCALLHRGLLRKLISIVQCARTTERTMPITGAIDRMFNLETPLVVEGEWRKCEEEWDFRKVQLHVVLQTGAISGDSRWRLLAESPLTGKMVPVDGSSIPLGDSEGGKDTRRVPTGIVLESWLFQLIPGGAVASTVLNLVEFAKHTIIQLRSVYTLTRLLPCYRLFRTLHDRPQRSFIRAVHGKNAPSLQLLVVIDSGDFDGDGRGMRREEGERDEESDKERDGESDKERDGESDKERDGERNSSNNFDSLNTFDSSSNSNSFNNSNRSNNTSYKNDSSQDPSKRRTVIGLDESILMEGAYEPTLKIELAPISTPHGKVIISVRYRTNCIFQLERVDGILSEGGDNGIAIPMAMGIVSSTGTAAISTSRRGNVLPTGIVTTATSAAPISTTTASATPTQGNLNATMVLTETASLSRRSNSRMSSFENVELEVSPFVGSDRISSSPLRPSLTFSSPSHSLHHPPPPPPQRNPVAIRLQAASHIPSSLLLPATTRPKSFQEPSTLVLPFAAPLRRSSSPSISKEHSHSSYSSHPPHQQASHQQHRRTGSSLVEDSVLTHFLKLCDNRPTLEPHPLRTTITNNGNPSTLLEQLRQRYEHVQPWLRDQLRRSELRSRLTISPLIESSDATEFDLASEPSFPPSGGDHTSKGEKKDLGSPNTSILFPLKN